MKPLDQCRLYTFVDLAYLAGRQPEDVAEQLCAGGADLIQLRAKNLPEPAVEEIAQRLLPITQRAGVGLVINDHLSMALKLGAPLCHLGQEDFFDAGHTHRDQLIPKGADVLLGLSTHSPEQAERAIAAGADYIAIGPVFATPTKPSANPVTLEYVRWAAEHINIPWFAIGGISLQNLTSVLEAGARRICVVSDILKAPDIAAQCQKFGQALSPA